jgi:hypothetical protein
MKKKQQSRTAQNLAWLPNDEQPRQMNNNVNASRTLAQAGAWLLDQDSTGRMWLRGPGRLDGVDLTAGGTIAVVDGLRATVTTPDTTIVIEVPARQAARLDRFVGLINQPPAPTRLLMTSTTEVMTPAVPVGSSMLICPHCQTRGQVTNKRVKRKTGIHGGKATAAIFTGGWSMLATGLSGKQMVTEAYCAACESRYQF